MSNKYSVVCRRCGRKLKSEASRNRGYGSGCYAKLTADEKRDNPTKEEIENLEGPDILKEVREHK